MTQTALADLYRAYIACLNRQDWPNLHRFVGHHARHTGRPFGLAGYRAMLERDYLRWLRRRFSDPWFYVYMHALRRQPARACSQRVTEKGA